MADRIQEHIREQVEERRRAEAEKYRLNASKQKPELSSRFVRDCLRANELGDGLIYAALHQGRFLFNKSGQEWLSWAGHFWQRDIMAESLAAVEDVAKRYLAEAAEMVKNIDQAIREDDSSMIKKQQDQQKAVYRRVSRLRSESGRVNCLKFAHTNTEQPLAVRGEEFDTDPWVLACKNGVIDLKTGRLWPGRPEDYISMASPVEWRGIEEASPRWDKFFEEVFDDRELIDFVMRLLGYGLTGLNVEHILPIFWGQGRNGKGTIVEILSHILGPLASPIVSEMLLDQGRYRSSAGPSPDIMGLRGIRLAFASESDEGRRFSPSKIKWLSGGDTLKGRYPHDKYETEFIPTHTLIMLTNHKPQAPAEDFAFWERVHLIPFKFSFVNRKPQADNERPADLYLKEKLKEEASGILASLVRGCIEWQRIGLSPPESVREATAEYRRDEDILADFIDECCYTGPEAEGTAAALYTAFSDWFITNISKKVISQKKFGRMMAKRFRREKRGTYMYYGIGLLSEAGDH